MIAAARTLLRLMPRSRHWVALGSLLALAQAAMLIPVGLLLKEAFDDAIPSGDVDGLVAIGVLLLALFLGSAAIALLTRRIVLAATKEAIAQLRIELVERLGALPLSWYDRVEAGRVHAIVVADSERVDVMANALAGQGAPAAIVSGALAVALLVVDPLLFAIMALVWPVMVLAARRMRPSLRERTRAWQEAFDRFSSRIAFALRGRHLIASHSSERAEEVAARREIVDLSARGLDMAWTQSLYGQVSATLGAIAAVIVLVVGGAAVADGRTTLGSLISFYALLGIFRGQAALLLSAIPTVISGAESLRRLEEILDLDEPPVYTGEDRIEWHGGFELRDVDFAYGREPVLSSVDLECAPGEWLALAGHNGAGKSTIAALVLGLYRPTRGRVSVDGVPLEELDVSDLRHQAALVPQDPILFAGSVAANVAFGAGDVDRAAVAEAVRLAGAGPLVEAMPDGLDTEVGDEGGLLSGGQRQLVALARALLRRPALLVLDEPTSELDRDLTPHVLDALRALDWRPSVLLISHDPAVLARADRVVQVEAGVVSADELLGAPARR